MGILLQEMVLDLPRVIDANAVGELYLFERFAIDSMLSISVPGSRNLVLIKDAEFHCRSRGPAYRFDAVYSPVGLSPASTIPRGGRRLALTARMVSFGSLRVVA